MSIITNNYDAQWRRRRMQIYPYCHWCTTKLIYYKLPPTVPKGGLPDNFATIDHLYDRFDKEKRAEAWKKKVPQRVLACNKCNLQRGLERNRHFQLQQHEN